MRIISQDGTIDIPYEQCVIQRFKTEIYFLNKNLTGVEQLVSDMEIATYSTEEKAVKAMIMLIEKHLKYMEIEGYVNPTGQGILQPNFWVLPKIFRFPQDDEIEV